MKIRVILGVSYYILILLMGKVALLNENSNGIVEGLIIGISSFGIIFAIFEEEFRYLIIKKLSDG